MVLNPGTIVNTEREVILLKAQLKARGFGARSHFNRPLRTKRPSRGRSWRPRRAVYDVNVTLFRVAGGRC